MFNFLLSSGTINGHDHLGQQAVESAFDAVIRYVNDITEVPFAISGFIGYMPEWLQISIGLSIVFTFFAFLWRIIIS